jgi:enoyl-CoA hydratase/carnithine racemase
MAKPATPPAAGEAPSRAKIILMAGSEYDADQALSFGLVDEVFDDAAALDAGVREFAALLASRSAVTQRAVKQTIARILDGVSADDESHAAARRRSREPRLRGGRPRLHGRPLPPVRLISFIQNGPAPSPHFT